MHKIAKPQQTVLSALKAKRAYWAALLSHSNNCHLGSLYCLLKTVCFLLSYREQSVMLISYVLFVFGEYRTHSDKARKAHETDCCVAEGTPPPPSRQVFLRSTRSLNVKKKWGEGVERGGEHCAGLGDQKS